MAPDQTAFGRLAYELSVRGLDNQEERLRELRARTGILLAASSLGVSFLGQGAFERAVDPSGLALIAAALIAFIITIAASLYILMPKQGLYFSPSGVALYEQLYALIDDVAEVYRRLAYELDRGWDSNEVELMRLFRAFRMAAIALGIEIVLLVALVSGTLF